MDPLRFYVYIVRRGDGTPFYVGKGTGSRYRALNVSRSTTFREIIASDPNAKSTIFRNHLSEAEAFDLERRLIRDIGREPVGTLINLSRGGEGFDGLCRRGWTQTPEARARIAEAVRNRSPETLAKMSKASSRPRTQAWILSHSGKPKSLESIAKRTATRRANAEVRGSW